MNKSIAAVAVVLLVGFAGFQIAEARGDGSGNRGRGPCNGACINQNSEIDQEAYAQFFADTTELRGLLVEKRSDYFAVLNQDNPDKEYAAQLWSEMFDIREQIQEKLSENLAEEQIIYENTGHLNKQEVYLAFTKTHILIITIDNPIQNWNIPLNNIELNQNKGLGFYLGLGYDIDLIIKFEENTKNTKNTKKISLGFSGIKYTAEVIKNIQDLLIMRIKD